MGRKYDAALLDALRRGARETVKDGVPILVKPIPDDFHALPPTLLAFDEHDFLAFEDFACARHAVKAGVRLKTIVCRGLGHGFADQIGVMPQGEDLMAEIAAMMEEVL